MHRVLSAVLLVGLMPIAPPLGAAGPRFIDFGGPRIGHRFSGAEDSVGHRFSGAEDSVGHRFSGAGADQLRVQTIDGGAVDPFAAPAGVTAIVFLFTSTECPISNRYAPEVRRLAAAFAPKGVVFRLIYVNPAERAPAIREHMTAFAYAGATQALRDPEHALVKFVGATVTPEAAVYAGGRIVYRGRIDDRHVDLGLERPAPTRRDLALALAAVIAGKPVAQPTTQAVGCFIADFAR
jgi:thiol-disulfide isomerase/thioredoxin